MGKILLTGVTGLVGSAFVVALLRDKPSERFVCIARSNGGGSAADRVAKVLREQCEFDSCPEMADKVIAAVEVIDGDVVDIVPEELAKLDILQDVDRVFHCAADVNLGKDPTGKTYKINFGGTTNMVKLAQLLKVKEFHQVSTAYVAGRISGRAMEEQALNSGFNNPYEQSKFESEMLVRNSGIPFSVYRPAIITGRLSDGRVRRPLAFYRIVEFLAKLKQNRCMKAGLNPAEWVDMDLHFRTAASERVYFVPIDYVQQAITALFQKPVCNRTYHVTGNSPVQVHQIQRAICNILKIGAVEISVSKESEVENAAPESNLMSKFLGDLLPYFASNITFDQRNITDALGSDFVNWDFGEVGLEKIVRSFINDFMPDSVWAEKK
ncbi:MAG: NAD-dependent epimerase/dehydratase family protein [Lentisphaerae bacterium]|nr:NAD-dependent epimerase/dehydratase family protein [Lentisphaerota bacterium]